MFADGGDGYGFWVTYLRVLGEIIVCGLGGLWSWCCWVLWWVFRVSVLDLLCCLDLGLGLVFGFCILSVEWFCGFVVDVVWFGVGCLRWVWWVLVVVIWFWCLLCLVV